MDLLYLENIEGALSRISPSTSFTSTPGTDGPIEHKNIISTAIKSFWIMNTHHETYPVLEPGLSRAARKKGQGSL